MAQRHQPFLIAGVFSPAISLDALVDQREADGGPAFDVADDAPSTEDLIAAAEGIDAVRAFVQRLSVRDREIVESHFWRGETQTEIAARQGVSKMAVCKAVARICRLGREQLADHRHLAFVH